MLLVPEVWGLFVTQLIHPGLTETVCTYLIPKYSGLGAGRWLPGKGWGLRSTPPPTQARSTGSLWGPRRRSVREQVLGGGIQRAYSPTEGIEGPEVCPLSLSFLQFQFSSVQLLSCVCLFATPWTAAHQASLSITNSRSLFKLMSIESVMPSNPSHPLSSPSPPAFNLAQYQGLS